MTVNDEPPSPAGPAEPTSPEDCSQPPLPERLAAALGSAQASVRLEAALGLGTRPHPGYLDVLVQRCAVEPDFYVRDMLTWAITRLPAHLTLPRIRGELGSPVSQARSQALHTLSKIGDPRAWPWITRDMLHDPHDDVARTAWRAAVALVPRQEERGLARELARELGRGDREVHRSLSRALVELGDVVEGLLEEAAKGPGRAAAVHARATLLLMDDPEATFDGLLKDARRMVAMGHVRSGQPQAGRGC